MRNFRDYEVWKKSIMFIKNVYAFTDLLPNKEKYNLISQLERAAVSISLNISEGCSRNSEKDFARFIEIALGSAFETENILIICNELGYTKEENAAALIDELTVIQKMLNSLYSKLTQRWPKANS
jgi:four helix bundle protein